MPLSAVGREQCDRANRKLTFLLRTMRSLEDERRVGSNGDEARPFSIDAFLVSPLTRSLQTAANSMHGLEWCKGASRAERHSAEGGDQCRQPIWIVDALLREKISTMGDVGSELQALRDRLVGLYSSGELQTSTFDFGLIPEQHEWWVPHTADQLKELVSNSEECRQCGNCWSETASTAASEAGEGAENTVLRLGNSVQRSLSSAEASVRTAFETAERPTRKRSAVDRRMAEWYANNNRLPRYQTVPCEGNDLLRLRAQLLLSILCRAKDAKSLFIVTHSLFLKILTGEKKFANAEFRAYTLTCEGAPKLVPL